jgi:translation elongation factor EF-G
VNFQDEVSAALRAADGVLLVVDAVEGVMLVTEKVVRQALTEGLPIALLITKVDRLITELKLPPLDAYFKLHHTIQEVNTLIATYSGGVEDLEVGNFASPPSPPMACHRMATFLPLGCKWDVSADECRQYTIM